MQRCSFGRTGSMFAVNHDNVRQPSLVNLVWFNRATMWVRHGRPNLSKSHCLSGACTFRIHKGASGTLTRSPGSWNEKLWISIAYTSNRFDRIACKQYVNLECESLKFLKEVHGTEGLPLYSVGGSFEFTTVVAILLSLKLLMLGSRFATVTARAKETLINLGSVHPTVQARFLLISWSSLKVKCCFAQLFDVRKICERSAWCFLMFLDVSWCFLMFLDAWFFSKLVKSPWLHQLMPGVASGFPLAGIASRRRSRDIIRGEETKMKLSWMLMNLIWELFLMDHSTVPKCYIHFGVLVSSCPRFCFKRIQKKCLYCVDVFLVDLFPAQS